MSTPANIEKLTCLAEAWAKEERFQKVELVAAEDGGAVFYLSHIPRLHGKNGLPPFIRVSTDGSISDSLHWSYEEIFKYYDMVKAHGLSPADQP